MANSANLVVRWALAYLLIINSIDTLTNNSAQYGVSNGSLWIESLIMFAAIINTIGGILLAAGWQVRNTSLMLAGSTGLFTVVYQEPIAIAVIIGLLILAYNARHSNTTSVAAKANTSLNGNTIASKKVSSSDNVMVKGNTLHC